MLKQEILELVVIKVIYRRKVADFNTLGPDKNTVLWWTFEVTYAIGRPVVLACWFVESNAYPCSQAWNLRDITDMLDMSAARVCFWKESAARADFDACVLVLVCSLCSVTTVEQGGYGVVTNV